MKTLLSLALLLCLTEAAAGGIVLTERDWEILGPKETIRLTDSDEIFETIKDLGPKCKDRIGKTIFKSEFILSNLLIQNPIIELFMYRQGRLLVFRPYFISPGDLNGNRVGWDFYCEIYE